MRYHVRRCMGEMRVILGSHLSIGGGLHKALLSADGYGFDTVAMFVRNHVPWRFKPLSDDAVQTFRRVRRRVGIGPVVAHGSYLVNLAGRAEVRRKSIAAMTEDLGRCCRLGIEFLVIHPGSRESPKRGIGLIASALNRIMDACSRRGTRTRTRTKILLETTAGQGNSIGWRFEQLDAILDAVQRPRRFGVCLDTCHVFAAGYDMRTAPACRAMLDELDSAVGMRKLMAIHLNDSRRELASRVDRHAHIGQGHIGLKGFAALVNDKRLGEVPMILETPKVLDEAGRDMDSVNAAVIRRLIRGCRRRKTSGGS